MGTQYVSSNPCSCIKHKYANLATGGMVARGG